MKKTVSKIVFLIVLLTLLLALVACSSGSVNGTYYEYNNGVKNDSGYITLDKNSWIDDAGETGRLEVKDGVVYGYYTIFDIEDVLFWGTVSDGVFKYTFGEKLPTGEFIYRNFYSDKSNASNKDSSNYVGEKSPTGSNKTTYTVSFDSCGGTSVANITAEQGSKLTAPTQPTRTMFVFSGWYKDSRYSNVWDFATDTVEGNTTLYAKWMAEEVRVTSVNGAEINGTDIMMVLSNSVDEVDLTDKVILNNDTATWKLYYDKLGQMEIPTKLATTQSGSFRPGSNLFYIVVTNADSTQSKTYTLDVYKRYEVQVKVVGVGKQLTTYNVMTLDTLSAPATQSITGYTINGYTSSGASIGSTVPKNSPTTITLTASVTANKYTATLNTNGGNLTTKTKTVTFNSRESLGVPNRTGYSFLGWYIGSTPVTKANGICSAWTYDNDISLSAEWQANRYEITVETDDTYAGSVSATGVDGSGSTVVGVYDSTVTLRATAKNGYSFNGWYNGTAKISSQATYNAPVTVGNVTYTAKWTYYTVTTATNMSEAGTYTQMYQNRVTAGNRVTLSASTNDGYTWLGWYDGDEKVSEGTSLSYSFSMSAENKILTAKWLVCPVTLEKNISEAGTVGGVERATIVGSETTITAVTNVGYTWLGWYDGNEKVSNETSQEFAFEMTIEPKIYTAKWSKATIEKNIDQAGNVTELTDKYVVGDSVTVSATTNIGYIWQGWYNGNNCLTKDLSYTLYMEENSIVYSAKWVECNHSLVDEVCTKCGATEIIIEMNNKGYCLADNYIYFGYYPQTIKAESITVGDDVDNDGYYLGSDGYRYAKVVATPYSNGYIFSNDVTVISGQEYYFKVEPIRWRILSQQDDTAFIFCDSIITNKSYNVKGSSRYLDSEIRDWLNNEFYNKSFNRMQRELMVETTINQGAYGQVDTMDDNIFLLSASDIYKASYGFSNVQQIGYGDHAKQLQTSDYSRATGVFMDMENNCGKWWLSTSYSGKDSLVRCVLTDGSSLTIGPIHGCESSYVSRIGIAPALKLVLNK